MSFQFRGFMKKFLLLPTILFPYLFSSILLCVYIRGNIGGKLVIALLICTIISLVLAFICNAIFLALSRKDDYNSLAKLALIVKIIHIPTYVFIFILGLALGLVFFMAIPLILLLVIVDYLTLFFSGTLSFTATIKSLKKAKTLSITTLVCQFFFCLDIISLIVYCIKIKKVGAYNNAI